MGGKAPRHLQEDDWHVSECGTQCDQWLAGMRCFSVGTYIIYFKDRSPVRILRVVHGGRDQENLLFEP